jgi:hypothetical protein
VYVVVDGSVAHRNHLAVRDALRADPELRDAYGSRKLRLADEVDDIWAYVAGKTDLVVGILARAGFTEDELEAVRAANRPARKGQVKISYRSTRPAHWPRICIRGST